MARMKLVLLASLLTASAAHADQCQIVTPAQAADAVKLLTGALITLNCPPCNDPPIATVPTVKPGKITQHAAAGTKGMSSVALDGKDVDLAYTWILTGKATFTNVAQAIGCDTDGVPGFVTIGKHAPTVDVAALEAQIAALDAVIKQAARDVAGARNEAERQAAKLRLDKAKDEQQMLRLRSDAVGSVNDANLAKLQADDVAISVKVDAAVQAFTGAQTEADRNAARARLEGLRKEQNGIRERIAAAKVNAARDTRARAKTITQKCIDNPLAKGC
jgi:hypothetical protein